MMPPQQSFRPLYAVDPYRSLAAAVLARAIQDGGRGGGVEWILRQTPDACFWCQVAGLDADCVAEQLRARTIERSVA